MNLDEFEKLVEQWRKQAIEAHHKAETENTTETVPPEYYQGMCFGLETAIGDLNNLLTILRGDADPGGDGDVPRRISVKI